MTEKMKSAFCVLLEITTDDPRINDEAMRAVADSAKNAADLRRAVLQHLPHDVSRVIMMLPVSHARAMCRLWDLAAAGVGQEATMPHPDYVPPTTE